MGKAEVLTRGEARHGRYGMGKAWHGMAGQRAWHGMGLEGMGWGHPPPPPPPPPGRRHGVDRTRRRTTYVRMGRATCLTSADSTSAIVPGVDAARSAHGMVPYGAVRFGMTREEGQARRKDESQARKQGSTSKQGSKGTRGQGRA